jgi:Protein of unknown function (DUF2569)
MAEIAEVKLKNLNGIAGWLLLFAIGMVVRPILLVLDLFDTYWTLAKTEGIGLIFDPSSEYFRGGLLIFIMFELIANIILVGATIYQLILFFKRSRSFPKFFIWVTGCGLLLLLVDGVIGHQFIPDEPMFDPEASRDLVRSFVSAAIWIPYVLVSKRVRATFIN